MKVPAYLLEGDTPAAPTATGPGEKFALGPETPAAHFRSEAAHLPETYGTGKLYVTPRDPHWLYTHWDIGLQQQFRHNARSMDLHLILRIHRDEMGGRPVAEIHLHPESRHWFAHVERSETTYVAELGYYRTGRHWKSLATSAPTKTPPDRVSADNTVEFATIPLDLPFETMLGLLREEGREDIPLARGIQRTRATRSPVSPPPPAKFAWTEQREQALAEFFAKSQTATARSGSHEISGLLGGWSEDEPEIIRAEEFEFSWFTAGETVSSPESGWASGSDHFWYAVGTRLNLEGATETQDLVETQPSGPEPA